MAKKLLTGKVTLITTCGRAHQRVVWPLSVGIVAMPKSIDDSAKKWEARQSAPVRRWGNPRLTKVVANLGLFFSFEAGLDFSNNSAGACNFLIVNVFIPLLQI